jgi:hypothetical protein
LLEQLSPVAKRPIADLAGRHTGGAQADRGEGETRDCQALSLASRVFRNAPATGRTENDPTSTLRGALIAPKVTHHSATLDPEAVGELLRSIDAYSENAINQAFRRMGYSAG